MPIVKDKPVVTLPLCTAAAADNQSVATLDKSKETNLHMQAQLTASTDTEKYVCLEATQRMHAQMELDTHLGWLSWPLSHC